jgi:hypothetical protein
MNKLSRFLMEVEVQGGVEEETLQEVVVEEGKAKN